MKQNIVKNVRPVVYWPLMDTTKQNVISVRREHSSKTTTPVVQALYEYVATAQLVIINQNKVKHHVFQVRLRPQFTNQ